MEIVRIFEGHKLYSFQYNGEELNEYHRLIDLWTDTSYLFEYTHRNLKYIESDEYDFINKVRLQASELEEIITDYCHNKHKNLDSFFRPLRNKDSIDKVVLTKEKGKKSFLRIYAIKIDSNKYVITGGAIKLTRLMEEHPDTKRELLKLEKCRVYLTEKGVFDCDSFDEYYNDYYES